MSAHLRPPPEVLAEWQLLANPENPSETLGNTIPNMEITLLVLSFLVVALRVYIRTVQTRSFGWDDGVVVFNLIPLTGMAVSMILGETFQCLFLRQIVQLT